jgi:hypothetical protein
VLSADYADSHCESFQQFFISCLEQLLYLMCLISLYGQLAKFTLQSHSSLNTPSNRNTRATLFHTIPDGNISTHSYCSKFKKSVSSSQHIGNIFLTAFHTLLSKIRTKVHSIFLQHPTHYVDPSTSQITVMVRIDSWHR